MSTQIPENFFYTEDHEWVTLDGLEATIGITDFAQSSLGDIVFLELPEVGSELEALASFGVVESIKSVSDLYTPIAGKVIAINSPLMEAPEKCNTEPYESWLIKIKMNNADDIKLMNSSEYSEFINKSH